MAELGEFLVTGDSKVHVEIDMLDYGYIEKCSDPQKLRAIVDVLKSGKEGFYPDLIQKAEDKLMSVLPVKERMQILRMKTQVTPAEIQEASAELDEWQECVEVLDSELRGKGSPPKRGKTLPPVRGTKREKLDVPQAKPVPAGGDSAGKSSSKAKERISGYNFPAWEKFDVDAAINEIDENESEAEKAKRVAAADAQKRAAEAVRQRALRHQKELDVFREEMKTSQMTEVQKKARAMREKQKGNEAFRAGENDEAYAFYSRSLALDDSSAVVYTNRAVLAIRMNKLETAVDDSSRAIALDPSYMKAYYRRGVARLKLGQTGDAIVDFQEALRKDPANKELTALLVKAKNKYQEVEGREFGAPTPPASVATAKNEDITTRVAVRVVSSAELLYLPAGERSVLASGALQEVIETDEDMQGGFTRIQIQDTDSEDEEEQECGKGVAEDTQESFTRIAIAVDDDDDDDDAPVDGVRSDDENIAGEQFTRIPISMDSDSDSDPDTVDDGGAKKLEEAVALKNTGNGLMQKGDLRGALEAYSTSLKLVPEGDNAIAVYCNRSLTHIKLEKYAEAVADASAVLSRDSNNQKALYRRSIACEASNDLPRALADIDRLLALAPDNTAALQAKSRVSQTITAAPPSPPPSPSLPPPPPTPSMTSNEENPEWLVETHRKEALAYMQQGEAAKAAPVLERALTIAAEGGLDTTSMVSLQHLLATAYAAVEDDSNALRVYGDILRTDNSNHKANLRSAETHLRMGNLEKARAFALTCLRLYPMDAEVRVLMDSIERARERLSPPKSAPPVKPAPPPESSSTAMGATNDESISSTAREAASAASLEKKNAGNDAMKDNDYLRAIELYTEAIDLDPSNMMFFNNRAQAYLKVSRFGEAEADSSLVIDANKRLPNLKALFRRALARKGINTVKSLTAALEDLSAILKAEPANKEAGKEKLRVNALLAKASSEESAALERAASTAASSPAGGSGGDGLVARSTRIKTPTKPRTGADGSGSDPAISTPGDTTSTAGTAPTAGGTATATPSSGSKRASPAVKKVVVHNPSVPSDPPKTVYELERVWRGLKNRPELFADYLKTFKKSTFKKVVKEAVSPDLVSSMLVSVRDHLVRNDTNTAFNVLEGLASTPNFGMTVSLLPAADIECVSSCIAHLTVHVDHERGQNLKQAYKL